VPVLGCPALLGTAPIPAAAAVGAPPAVATGVIPVLVPSLVHATTHAVSSIAVSSIDGTSLFMEFTEV
jgi:hypothetical protein